MRFHLCVRRRVAALSFARFPRLHGAGWPQKPGPSSCLGRLRPSDIAARPVAKGLQEALDQTFVTTIAAAGGNRLRVRAKGPADVTRSDYSMHRLSSTERDKTMPFNPASSYAVTTCCAFARARRASFGAGEQPEGVMAHIRSQQGKFHTPVWDGNAAAWTSELFRTVGRPTWFRAVQGVAPAINDVSSGTRRHVRQHDRDHAVHQVRRLSDRDHERETVRGVPTCRRSRKPASGVESYACTDVRPAKTPKDVVTKLNEATVTYMKSRIRRS